MVRSRRAGRKAAVRRFKKELYKGGNVNQRLANEFERASLINFLASELMACKLLKAKYPKEEKPMEVTVDESDTARRDCLKKLLVTLKFQKPSDNISPELSSRLETKLSEVLNIVSIDHIDKPLIEVELSAKQWEQLDKLKEEIHQEYIVRRDMLLKHLHVTVDSSLPDIIKPQENEVNTRCEETRKIMENDPEVTMADLPAARDDLAVIEETSNASVCRNTESKINSVSTGEVPNRDDRPDEQEPPPPEMPPQQKERVPGP